ncbi:unnamed protein product [marine sediment metagenome]|uniref:Uncharacterized protein n=1 Tax=marine sediment metagenome TaxID=412755 RepID=X0RJI5_9ZZZZ
MIKTLKKHLKDDPDFYYAYQSNIAMAFFDAYNRCDKKYKNRGDLHKIANEAAKNFLDLLIST